MAVAAVSAQDNIYSFKVKNDKGEEVSLEQYKGLRIYTPVQGSGGYL